MPNILRDRRGMSLLEVLVAVGVIVVGLVGVMAVAPMATGAVGEANLKTTATFLAQQRLEEMKNMRWSTCNALDLPNPAPCNTDRLGGDESLGNAPVAAWPNEEYKSIVLCAPDDRSPATPDCPRGAAKYPGFKRITRITDCSAAACGTLAADPSRATLRQISVTVFFAPHIGTGQLGTNEEFVNITSLVARRP
jgi:prepilin-type N-terminal cleavage/methylation domain-containing protein